MRPEGGEDLPENVKHHLHIYNSLETIPGFGSLLYLG